jgi:hypothetical protein
MMNYKGCRRKRSWLIFKVNSRICMVGLSKTTKHLSQEVCRRLFAVAALPLHYLHKLNRNEDNEVICGCCFCRIKAVPLLAMQALRGDEI